MFNGSTYLLPTKATKSVRVMAHGTKLTFNIAPRKIYLNDEIVVTGTVRGDDNTIVNDGMIEITFEDNKNLSLNAEVANGEYRVTHVATAEDMVAGTHRVYIRFYGSEYYPETLVDTGIDIEMYVPVHIITHPPYFTLIGDDLVIKGRVNDVNNMPVSGGVHVYLV